MSLFNKFNAIRNDNGYTVDRRNARWKVKVFIDNELVFGYCMILDTYVMYKIVTKQIELI